MLGNVPVCIAHRLAAQVVAEHAEFQKSRSIACRRRGRCTYLIFYAMHAAK